MRLDRKLRAMKSAHFVKPEPPANRGQQPNNRERSEQPTTDNRGQRPLSPFYSFDLQLLAMSHEPSAIFSASAERRLQTAADNRTTGTTGVKDLCPLFIPLIYNYLQCRMSRRRYFPPRPRGGCKLLSTRGLHVQTGSTEVIQQNHFGIEISIIRDAPRTCVHRGLIYGLQHRGDLSRKLLSCHAPNGVPPVVRPGESRLSTLDTRRSAC
jgi:hypothetical protein